MRLSALRKSLRPWDGDDDGDDDGAGDDSEFGVVASIVDVVGEGPESSEVAMEAGDDADDDASLGPKLIFAQYSGISSFVIPAGTLSSVNCLFLAFPRLVRSASGDSRDLVIEHFTVPVI